MRIWHLRILNIFFTLCCKNSKKNKKHPKKCLALTGKSLTETESEVWETLDLRNRLDITSMTSGMAISVWVIGENKQVCFVWHCEDREMVKHDHQEVSNNEFSEVLQ